MLNDFGKWRKLNPDSSEKPFSIYDYLFQIVNVKKIHSDLFFAFKELFWPSFVEYKNRVFLKECFSEEKTQKLIQQNQNAEFWINMVLLDAFFEDNQHEQRNMRELTDILIKIWSTKLSIEFSGLKFSVVIVQDQEFGDYGITFYQGEV